MLVKEINDRNEWDSFFSDLDRRTFLNSWDWGEFRKALGDKVWRRGIFEKDKGLSLFMASKVSARKGNFLLLAHSPTVKEFSEALFRKTAEEIIALAKQEKVDFIRIAPAWEKDSDEERILKEKRFRLSPCFVFPRKSWELPISGSEDVILSGMRKGTRYMIKKALKENNLEIVFSKKGLKGFYEIYQKTAKHQGFTPFSLDYIEKEFEVFSRNDRIALILACYKEKFISGAIIVFWEGVAFYHHGASLFEYKDIPASHLVQWEAIKEAKRRNCEKYNFWAIAPKGDPKHHWAGLTFFKKGFGGREIDYAPAKDLPLTPKYYLTYLSERMRR